MRNSRLLAFGISIWTVVAIASLRSEGVQGESFLGSSQGEVLVRFDDGEEIPISLFGGTYAYGIPRDSPLAMQYEALAQASNTRGDIALALSDALEACQQAPTSQSEIDTEVAAARAGNRLVSSLSTHPEIPAADTPAADQDWQNGIGKQLAAQMAFCEGVTSEQKAKANYWLAKAADLGDPIAALRYGELLASQERVRYLEASWRAGEGGALHSLAVMYREGRASPDRKPDFVQAYAYEYLFVKATDAWAGPIESRGPVRIRWIARAQAELQSLEPHLNATEKTQAIAQAKAMLKANANCCLPM